MKATFRYHKVHASDVSYKFDAKYRLLLFVGIFQILFGLTQNSIPEIFQGIWIIIKSPDTLITDYIELANMGAAFVNSGMLVLVFTAILYKLKQRILGVHIAAIFTIAGFALFGKNIMNVWFVLIGVKLYSLHQKEKFANYLIAALFSTALSPVVTEVMFGTTFPLFISIPLGIASGIILGFLLPTLSASLVNVHHGLSLYNVGFTAGMIATVYISILKSYGFVVKPKFIWSTGNNMILGIYLILLFTSIIGFGFFLNGKSFKGYKDIIRYPGRLVTDFIQLEGTALTFINIGIMGIISTLYLLAIKGDINGPTIGGIFTIAGFAAFGKHPKNVIPIFIGVIIASTTKIFSISDPSIQLAALFGTSLAPIAGEFGFMWGIVAALCHSSVVLNVGALYGGLNLYNNGFSAGLVAAVLVPIIRIFNKEDK